MRAERIHENRFPAEGYQCRMPIVTVGCQLLPLDAQAAKQQESEQKALQ